MMRYVGTTVIPDNPGQFGISLPQDAEVIHVEHDHGQVTLHYLCPVEARWADADLVISYSGMHVTPDMHFVGMYRRTDGMVRYVFIRRD